MKSLWCALLLVSFSLFSAVAQLPTTKRYTDPLTGSILDYPGNLVIIKNPKVPWFILASENHEFSLTVQTGRQKPQTEPLIDRFERGPRDVPGQTVHSSDSEGGDDWYNYEATYTGLANIKIHAFLWTVERDQGQIWARFSVRYPADKDPLYRPLVEQLRKGWWPFGDVGNPTHPPPPAGPAPPPGPPPSPPASPCSP